MSKPSHLFYFLSVTSLFFFSSLSFAGSTAYDWSKITSPSYSNTGGQSIGGYANGCLKGATSLPLQGQGYQVMRLSRQRFYGHPLLIEFIQKLGIATDRQDLGSLLIGDLGQARGGPTLSGHRSHQTGLDVDIWFLVSKLASKRLLSIEERETWNAPALVNLKTDKLDYQQWSPVQKTVLAMAAQQPEVDRIFVNPSIKRELCLHKTAADTWLYKIRPWWKHEDHFHVRLKCPPNNPYCEKQAPLSSKEDGCDASLDWWFSAEAKNPAPAPPAPPVELPELCEQLLKE